MASDRIGDWILTGHGHRFWPFDPRPEEVDLQDIALALSHLCRWTGHTCWHYSVAQHAVAVAVLVERFAPDLALAALHHDSAEAYLGDWARPVKRRMRALTGTLPPPEAGTIAWTQTESIEVMEERVLGVIFDALGVARPEREWEVIRVADNLVLRQEQRVLLPPDDAPGWARLGEPPAGIDLPRLTPEEAREQFLTMHRRLAAAVKA